MDFVQNRVSDGFLEPFGRKPPLTAHDGGDIAGREAVFAGVAPDELKRVPDTRIASGEDLRTAAPDKPQR